MIQSQNNDTIRVLLPFDLAWRHCVSFLHLTKVVLLAVEDPKLNANGD